MSGREQEQSAEDVVRRLQDLLVYPREDLDRELKNWINLSNDMDKADLAQAILALANHGGGYILIGFTRSNGNWIPDQNRPANLDSFSQDIINGIVEHYADPSFHCEVHHVPHPDNRLMYPVIIVPGNHKVPIRAKRDSPDQRHVRLNTYYIRRPGPKSEAPQSSREWDDLLKRCIRASRAELLDDIRNILYGVERASQNIPSAEEEDRRHLDSWIEESTLRWKSLVEEKLPEEKPSRYQYGTWIAAYTIKGEFSPPDLEKLREILRKIEGRETGWPPWLVLPSGTEISPYPFNGLIECWLKQSDFPSGAHSDFWRADPQGYMFLLRGYQEDASADIKPGTIFDLILPIWRVGECLLHAERLSAELISQPTLVRFRVIWKGLANRNLVSWANKDRFLSGRRISRQDSVSTEIVISSDRISATLPEIVKSLTQPLYEIFDFFKPPLQMIQEELSRMTGRKPSQ